MSHEPIVLVLAFVLASAGCVRSASVTCADGALCPTGRVCDEVNHACVYPDQLTSCVGAADGTACDIHTVPGGICRAQICIPAACGDGLVAGAEVCDGADDTPAVGTCVDFNYGYGSLTCSALCEEGFDSCRRLGWQFRTLPSGGGTVGGLWEDGDDLWLAYQPGIPDQPGIMRRHAGTWELVPPGGAASGWYHGVWAGGGHAFAVAHAGSVAHFDGTTWASTQVTASVLFAVWGRSPTDVFAVGGALGTNLGEVWHFDGTTWASMPLPASTPTLHAVWGAGTDVFAVGNGGTIVRLTGTWRAMTLPATGDLRSVWGSSATDVFAVGLPNPLVAGADAAILHYDGNGTGTWSSMTVPSGTTELRGVSGRSATEVYAVGARAGNNILYYDGRGWTPMMSGNDLVLNTVVAGPNGVYAGSQAFLEYQGAGWLETTPGPSDVRALWGTGADYLIGAGDGLAFHEYKAGTWTDVGYPGCWGATNFVFGVWGSSASNWWIVGPYGKLLHKTATTLDCVTAPSAPSWLVDIWGSGANDVFAVGANGANTDPNLIHFDGGAWSDWSDRVRPFVPVVSGVWGSGAGDVYATGGTKVLHYNGATWSDSGLVTTHTMVAIWGSSASDVFAAGSEGAMFHFDGTAWTQMMIPAGTTIPTDVQWTKLYGTGPHDVYAVGGRTLLHYDGTAWAPVARTLTNSIEAVWAVPGTVLTAGEGGIYGRMTGGLQ
jgi:hypothetical protein